MSPSPKLANAIAEREAAAGKKPTGKLDIPQRKWLATELPELAAEAPFPAVGDVGTAARTGSADVIENEAVQKANIAPSYSAYLSQMSRGMFLGREVIGHPQFLARVSNADSYLAAKMGKAPAKVAQDWGIETVVGLRPSTPRVDQLYHGTGFALDVNADQNNWNFGNGPHISFMKTMMLNVQALLGQAVAIHATDLAKTKGKTTEEIYEAVAQSNEALKRYRRLANAPDELARYLESAACPPTARALGLAEWKRRMAVDEAAFNNRTQDNETQEGPAGFMDQQRELIVALRDVAGLRWGASDFGKTSGDVMHFDGHHMPLAGSIRKAKEEVAATRKGAATQKDTE